MNPDCPFGGCARSAGNTTSGAIRIQASKAACLLASTALEASTRRVLFDSDALGQVAGLVHIQAPVGGDVIAEQLHGNHR